MTGGMAGWDSLEFDREALLALAQRAHEGVYFVDPARVIRFRSRGAWACDCLGRWGGEEFLAVIQCVGAEDLKKVAARCRELGVSVRAPVGEAQVRVTLSAGVAAVGECRSVAERLGLAGERPYLAKRAGRNRAEGPPGAAEGAAEGEAAA